MRLHLHILRSFAITASMAGAITLSSPVSGISLISLADAKGGHESGHDSGHDSGHADAGHQGKGPKYQGGRQPGASSRRGAASHGGASKTLEDVVFHADRGDEGNGHGKGPKYMGGGKGGHEEGEEDHGEPGEDDGHDHAEPQ